MKEIKVGDTVFFHSWVDNPDGASRQAVVSGVVTSVKTVPSAIKSGLFALIVQTDNDRLTPWRFSWECYPTREEAERDLEILGYKQ